MSLLSPTHFVSLKSRERACPHARLCKQRFHTFASFSRALPPFLRADAPLIVPVCELLASRWRLVNWRDQSALRVIALAVSRRWLPKFESLKKNTGAEKAEEERRAMFHRLRRAASFSSLFSLANENMSREKEKMRTSERTWSLWRVFRL